MVNKNPHLFYRYSGDQVDTIVVTPSGGTGPYTVSVTMNRKMLCNYINDAGDEAWKTSSGTTTNNVCGSITGPPVSTATITAGGRDTIYVTMLDSAVYTVTVTDPHMCNIYTKSDSIWAEDVRCFAGNSGNAKVQLCHKTGSDKNPCVSICVDASAVEEHLAHGDTYGACPKTGPCPQPSGITSSGSNSSSSASVLSDKLQVKIMPNPSVRGVPFILTAKGKANEEIEVRVVNIVGQEVYKTRGSINETYKFGNQFVAGTYFVQVMQGESMKTLKVVKQ